MTVIKQEVKMTPYVPCAICNHKRFLFDIIIQHAIHCVCIFFKCMHVLIYTCLSMGT